LIFLSSISSQDQQITEVTHSELATDQCTLYYPQATQTHWSVHSILALTYNSLTAHSNRPSEEHLMESDQVVTKNVMKKVSGILWLGKKVPRLFSSPLFPEYDDRYVTGNLAQSR
jgi:hypothetical protein